MNCSFFTRPIVSPRLMDFSGFLTKTTDGTPETKKNLHLLWKSFQSVRASQSFEINANGSETRRKKKAGDWHVIIMSEFSFFFPKEQKYLKNVQVNERSKRKILLNTSHRRRKEVLANIHWIWCRWPILEQCYLICITRCPVCKFFASASVQSGHFLVLLLFRMRRLFGYLKK